jgi:hypothetical protein
MSAGRSAAAEAEHSRHMAAAHLRAAEAERARADAFAAGGRGETLTGQVLDRLTARRFVVLHDRHWPGTRRSNIDHLVVGPSGVFVVDTKSWAGTVAVGGGMLSCDGEARDDEVDKVLAQAEAVEDVLTVDGLAPLEVVPLMAFSRAHGLSARLGRVRLTSPDLLAGLVVERGHRLTDGQVDLLARRLEEACPPARAPSTRSTVLPPVVVPHQPAAADALFDDADLDRAELEAAQREPIEKWMTFLHPDQVRLVRRGFNGPSRIRGPAGTGKTVVGLHRAAYLASAKPGPILFTTFVKTLPVVLERLYRRMAPDTADRVEFAGLHGWSYRLLADRGVTFRYDPSRAETCFSRAFSNWPGRRWLVGPSAPFSYWRDEIQSVIKGRGLIHFEEYAALSRTGRKTRLSEDERACVWELHTAYDGLLREYGIVDHNDLLAMALASVRDRSVEPSYAAVIADEVQDLNLLGAQLLHALVGDAPDGLTLVGDGQQAIYPGGYTLAEAGIHVAGRAAVLRTNYRNTREILAYATRLVASDEFADLEAQLEAGERDVTVVRDGPEPVEVTATEEEQDAVLLSALSAAHGEGVRLGDMAVLTATNALAGRFAKVLRDGGFPTISLEAYDGESTDRVKVGTVKRAKGLEFARVFLPAVTRPDGGDTDADAATLERLERERREYFVGMTRARDYLWVGVAE